MNKKSDAYYRYKAEQARDNFPYFEIEDIEQIVFDLLEDSVAFEALNVLDLGLRQHPNCEELIKMKILILIHFKRIEEATELFSPFANDGSEASETLKFAFEVVAGRGSKALVHQISLLRHKKISSLDFVGLIDEMWDELKGVALVRYILKASELITDSSEALARLGAMLMDLDYKEYAMDLLEKALDIDAYDIYSWQDLARCAFQLQNYEKCEEACDFGLAVDPSNPLLSFMRGFIRGLRSDFKGAIEDLNLCRRFAEGKLHHEEIGIPVEEREAQLSMTYDMLGQCYMESDNVDEAIECFEKLVARMPENHLAHFNLSRLYLDKGNLPFALNNIEKAIKSKKRDTAYLALKSSILASMLQFDEALATLDKLIKIKPKSMNFVLAKAELALGTKRFEIADKEFRKLLTMKPKEQVTKTLLREYFMSIGDSDALGEIDKF